eukprot:scaffold46957_cov51-Phaeocystis_antarctica.AAC.3
MKPHGASQGWTSCAVARAEKSRSSHGTGERRIAPESAGGSPGSWFDGQAVGRKQQPTPHESQSS